MTDDQLAAPTPCAHYTVGDLFDHFVGPTIAFHHATKTTKPGGPSQAGGPTLPADVMGTAVLDELVLHGWDLPRATGQPFGCDPRSAEACFAFTSIMSAPEQEAGRTGLFGPVVAVPADAPLFDRVLGFSGRDPFWTPAGAADRA